MINPRTTIKELQALLRDKKISPAEITEFYHNRLTEHAAKLNCAVEVFDKQTSIESIPSDALLSGIPGLVKDNICQEGQLTSAGSNILKNYRAPYESTVTSRLKKAGAISLGRANMDEFGMGASGEYSVYGSTHNPWNRDHSPGGSSAGSAAAVGAGLVPWALGTETGGSVRQPAAFCGLVGMYPTYGRFSRYGLLAFCSSTDQPGLLTKTVYDNALLASQIAGHDPHDASSLAIEAQDFTANLSGSLPDGLRIGVLKDAIESDGVDEQVKEHFLKAVHDLEKMGATIEYVSIPNLKYGISLYFILSRAEAASNLSRYDGSLYGNRTDAAELHDMYVTSRHDGFGKEVQRRLLMGNYVLSSGHRDAYYTRAQRVRDMLRQEYQETFRSVDVLMSPTTATLPFKLGKALEDPLKIYMGDYFTVPNCIIGMPAISLPCGFSKEGLPIGFQFMGPRLSEARLFEIAHAFEQSHDYHTQFPADFVE